MRIHSRRYRLFPVCFPSAWCHKDDTLHLRIASNINLRYTRKTKYSLRLVTKKLPVVAGYYLRRTYNLYYIRNDYNDFLVHKIMETVINSPPSLSYNQPMRRIEL